MRARKFLTLIGVALAATLTLAACGSGSGSGAGGTSSPGGAAGADHPFRVAAFTAGYGTPVAKSTLDSFVTKGKALGWDVQLYTSAFDYDKINNDVQGAITQGVDAVVAGFPDPRQIGPLVRAAKDANVPIFSIDGGVQPNEDFVVDVTSNQQQIADQTVGALKTAMGGLQGKNVMIIGHDPHVGIQRRSHLAEDELTAGGATIVGGDVKQILNPGTAHEESLKFVTDYLQANPNGLDGVWVGFDAAALGATQAISEAGKDIPVTGVDAIGSALAEIKQGGPFYATVVQDWPKVLSIVLDDMKVYAADGTKPSSNFVQTDVTLVTEQNVDQIAPTDQ